MIRRWLLPLLLSLPLAANAADKVTVAAAANLVYAIDALKVEFKKVEAATELQVVMGASGSLVAQIQNGAPFDVFLSADLEYPQQLIDRGLAGSPAVVTFAVGRLVLWSTRPGVDVSSIPALIDNPKVKRIAVANLITAPYGKATREALMRLNLWAEAEPRIVYGENVTQTAQFVETGNADAGFVALSLVLSPKLTNKDRWQEVDPSLHSPLEQGAAITKRGANNPASARFMAFLRSEEARAVFERFGYRVPKS